MKVNMTPNPLDVVTIHASQGDTEARQWEFELHNNGELIDTSEITEQLFFKAYKGGTEQLLPENTSTPTTSPFLGDIKYPQGLLTDQEFTYRQSPTESDGLAKITDIKGNTIVWNQLVQNGNFATTSGWTTSGRGTLTVSDNIATITPLRSGLIVAGPVISIKQGHKYLLSVEVKADSTSVWVGTQYNDVHARLYSNGTNQWQRMTTIVSNFANDSQSSPVFGDYRTSGWTASQIRNFMFIDLTQMGLDITDPSDFTSLFPLPYYAYNQGTLLSFMGNGIKTVGKNLFDGVYNNLAFANTVGQDPTFRGYTLNVSALKGKQITVSRADTTSNNRFRASFFSVEPHSLTPYEKELNNGNQYYSYDSQLSFTLTVPNGANYLLLYISNNRTVAKDLMIEIGSVVSDYEPYTSSTLSLPISTYFPNGMDGVGTDYDELTNTKATTRMTRVDLGTIAWGYNTTWSSIPRFYSPVNAIHTKIPGGNIIPNFRCVKYKAETSNNVGSSAEYDKCISVNPDGRVYIQDSSFTDPVAFKESLSGIYLVYPLATPTETSFTTASLVTENAEIPLSNEDDVLIGKCTEQLSENPGFIDAKIKLSDGDGECYSNKIQLHVERSPQ